MRCMRVAEEDTEYQFFAHDKIRNSQRKMISDAIKLLSRGDFLLAAAPTGLGKTAAALASSIEVIRYDEMKERSPKIIFMTGRQSQHKIIVDTVKKINKKIDNKFMDIKLVDLIGREGMCKNVDKSTGNCDCEEGLSEQKKRSKKIQLEDFIFYEPRHVDNVIKLGREIGICSWKTAREISWKSDIIVCDYNHIFIDSVRESSLPAMGVDLENSILIVDEAHNLPNRIRNGLQRRITEDVFQRAWNDIHECKGTLEQKLGKVGKNHSKQIVEMNILSKQMKALIDDKMISNWFEEKSAELLGSNKDDIIIDTDEFIELLSNAIQGIDDEYGELGIDQLVNMIERLKTVIIEEDDSIDDDEQNDCIRLAEMLEICIQFRNSDAMALVFDRAIKDKNRISSHLLDPSIVGSKIFKECLGSILMSGTLYPPEMYVDLLGIPVGRAECNEYDSGFDPNNRPILISTDVTSKYSERESCYSKMIGHINSVIEKTDGNIAIFAPSYSMLSRIESDISYTFGKKRLKEDQGMSKRAVNDNITRLRQWKSMGAEGVLFGVLGGKFSEGVDYSDNILNSVICIGLPLPPPSSKQEALINYYSAKFGRKKAWKYASLQPALNNVLQALGRPIRKSQDKAIIVLLEKRLLEREIFNSLPKSFQIIRTSNPSRTANHVSRFFEMQQSMGSIDEL